MAMENSLKSSKSFSRELNGYKFKMFEGGGGFLFFVGNKFSSVKDSVERNNNKMQTPTQSMHVWKGAVGLEKGRRLD
jgi:hypothetical protein